MKPGSIRSQTTPDAWGETSIRDLASRGPLRDGADIAGPVHMGMASELPGVTRREGAAAGRVVVVGTSLMRSADIVTALQKLTGKKSPGAA